MEAAQFRIARPTNQLKEVVEFYKNCLGLSEIGKFEGHDGYDGVMLGLPDSQHHLEFTQHDSAPDLPMPSKEHLLVFYFETPEKFQHANLRMQEHGQQSVEPENSYWANKGKTYEDPDGYRVVLYDGVLTYNHKTR